MTNPSEDAYKAARATGDFSAFAAAFTDEPKPEAEETKRTGVFTVPEEITNVIRRAIDADWSPELKAQYIGANFLDGDMQFSVLSDVTAQLKAGATGSEAALEAAIKIELHKLKVKQEAERRVSAESFRGTEELTWDDLAAAKKDFLVKDLVPRGAFVTLCARSNLGKTFTYVDMALRMVTGLDWLGKTTQRVKVLIVLGEGKAGFLGRIRAWLTAHDKTIDDVRDWLAFIDRANLNNDESLRRVAEVAERHGAELVIYDTWAGVSGIQREDDAPLNNKTFERIEDAMPDLTHFFVHHPRKAEQDTEAPVMRGSGAFEGRMDIVMMMYRDRGFIPASGEKYDFIALSTEQDHNGKAREAQTETIRGLYLDEVPVDGEVSRVMRQVTSEVISREGRRVREVLVHDMGATQFANAAQVSKATAHRWLNKATEEGVCIYDDTMPGAAVWKPNHKWTTLLSKAAA